MTIVERRNVAAIALERRMEQVPINDIVTTIITYEEQMRGWLALASQSTSIEKMVTAYDLLQEHVATFRSIPLLPFDSEAAAIFVRLRKLRIRIGTMDLKIASIALAQRATVITRNVRDFTQVPGLRVEDWSQ